MNIITFTIFLFLCISYPSQLDKKIKFKNKKLEKTYIIIVSYDLGNLR